MTLGGVVLGIISIFLPPLAVFIRRGCGADILINIGLCLLGWIPGVVHAWYIILEYPSYRQRRRIRHGHRRRSVTSARSVSPGWRKSQEMGSVRGGSHHGDRYVRRRSVSRGVDGRRIIREEVYTPAPPRRKVYY